MLCTLLASAATNCDRHMLLTDVFDVTDFLSSHPGGSEKLMQAAGKAVEPYWNVYR
jgi:cytochrome b involved in lipid metabolism